MDKRDALKKQFGHENFRPGQETLIDGILSGRDVLGVMPTGGGKSVCYQLPALLLPGVTIVVSPLISLMKDQVAALTEAGIRAAFVNSSLSGGQVRTVYRRAWAGEFQLLYVAPERLAGEGFVKLAQGLEVSLVAVDEAHCVSQWGQDFRPSYLKIPEFLDKLPRRPAVAAFTATATSQVREDIVRLLGLERPLTLVTGYDRPNLYFEVCRPRSKSGALRDLLLPRMGKSGIIYCATRAGVEKVCEELRDRGLPATRYHAGLDEEERRRNQDDFRFDRAPIMVATNAFGMGIDKSNVSYVIHYNMPKSLEAYYQEAGRAGRDGERAECFLLYSGRDVETAKFLIENGSGNDELTEEERAEALRRDHRRLEAMVGYCRTGGCLRGYLLDYFGQEHADHCGDCGNCLGDHELADVTTQAQMVLSCVRRVEDRLGYNVGAALIAQTLSGSANKRVLELGLDELSTYGLMRGQTTGQVREYIDFLKEKGYLEKEPEHGALRLTKTSGEILFRGRKLEMPIRKSPADEGARTVESGLFQALKDLRYRLSQKEGVPPFVIFSNATLTDMAARRPRSVAEFLRVSGVGEVKARKYASAFLLAIGDYEAERE
ncbi:MAG: DNA helicase RecQ [Oscillospiraceae bacterium]|jgi:ATP-dependent DNA helicase RecQ